MPEPRWIAFELHDGLMQWVIGARMHLSALIATVKEQGATEDLDESLMQILAQLNQATEEGRHLIRFIEGLDESESTDAAAALKVSCEVLIRKAREGSPELIFMDPEPPWPQLAPRRAWSIVRIVQQAAINAVRHSGGDWVRIQLGWTEEGEGLQVLITDNGHGFDPLRDYPGHFGLRSMRQRARETGWELEIDSSASGTQVRITGTGKDLEA